MKPDLEFISAFFKQIPSNSDISLHGQYVRDLWNCEQRDRSNLMIYTASFPQTQIIEQLKRIRMVVSVEKYVYHPSVFGKTTPKTSNNADIVMKLTDKRFLDITLHDHDLFDEHIFTTDNLAIRCTVGFCLYKAGTQEEFSECVADILRKETNITIAISQKMERDDLLTVMYLHSKQKRDGNKIVRGLVIPPNDADPCPVCYKEPSEIVMFSFVCKHALCLQCIDKYMSFSDILKCPMCRDHITFEVRK